MRGVEVENCLLYARSRRYRVVSEQKGDHSLILIYYFLFLGFDSENGFSSGRKTLRGLEVEISLVGHARSRSL